MSVASLNPAEIVLADLPLVTAETLALPEVRRSPAAFRTAVRISKTNWHYGSMSFMLPSGLAFRVQGTEPGPDALLIIRDFRFIGRVMAAGDIGFGEGFIANEWDSPNLSAVLQAFTMNWDRLARL